MEILKIITDKFKSGWMYPGVNKYTVTIFVFCIWIGFLDRYSMINQYKLSRTVHRLESSKSEYEEQLDEALRERETINEDIEKFARERYLFHKDNERVILIEDI